MLQLGLTDATDFSLKDLAETLPQTETPTAKPNSELKSDQSGLQRYSDLQAVHDWSAGTVYRAFHEGLQRCVLLRVLESSADDDDRREFLRRAEKLSHLNHAHTALTFEAGVDHGAAYVAEEWVEGLPVNGFLPRDRRERWTEGFFPNSELIRIMRDVASGLDSIHRAGLTHDRINPDSIVIDDGGIVKLIGLGEASESSDDRFAMPDDHSAHGGTGISVAADLFQLGATFCFLTTGKLPVELDPVLDVRVLAQRLKQINHGLRSEFCRVIATCIARENGAEAVGKQRRFTDEDPQTVSEHPYQSTAKDDRVKYASAADLVDELNRLLQSSANRVAWRNRIFSGYLEALCCFMIAGFTYSTIADRHDSRWSDVPISLTTSIYLFPILYTIVFETLFGWTIVRRLFGMRLLDHAGERSVWWSRFWRAIQKTLLLVLAIALPAMTLPLLRMFDIPAALSMTLLPVLELILPALAMYLPSRWIPSRWTTYDLAAGVTWGEEMRMTETQNADAVPTGTHQSLPVSPKGKADQYELYEPLGSGGMGQVFRGRDTVLGRDVAIKLLSDSLVENPLLLERFQREARLAAKINHPGVAKVFGNGIWGRTPYIAMELVPGDNLQQRIKDHGKLPITNAWDYVVQAAEALRAANLKGVVHRDIKPANLMVTNNGQLKVTDFGVSRTVELEPNSEPDAVTDPGVTRVGTIVGTPAYMAPEQAMGKEVDCRGDIYALGMTLYHMLSGDPPFRAKSAAEMLSHQMSEQPKSLFGQISELTHDQARVLERMIAKKPEDRYSNYDALLHDLNLHAPGTDQLANPLKRITAEACNLIALYLLFALGIMIAYLGIIQLGSDSEFGMSVFAGLVILLVMAVLGIYIIGVGRKGLTPGKRQLGLRVVRPNHKSVGYMRAAIRFAVAYPLLVVFSVRLAYYASIGGAAHPMEDVAMYALGVVQLMVAFASIVMMWVRQDRKTLHDLAAGTIVLRAKR